MFSIGVGKIKTCTEYFQGLVLDRVAHLCAHPYPQTSPTQVRCPVFPAHMTSAHAESRLVTL